MKSMIMTAMGIIALLAVSCQQHSGAAHEHDAPATTRDSAVAPAPAPASAEAKKIRPAFATVDGKVAAVITEAVSHYFHVKNELVADNAANAAAGAREMVAALGKLDKSYFSAEEKKAYDELEKGLKDHASQIAGSADIKAQRAHFVDLSNGVYGLVKAFGAGKTVYHDYCPMANDDKGALWVSEISDIKNPYFGASMLTCGSVEEEIN